MARSGVFAALYGTVALLPDRYRALVKGFVINKLRGDPALLLDGTEQLRQACGVPTLGVVPMLSGLALDAEDSLALDKPSPFAAVFDDEATSGLHEAPDVLDVAVIRFPLVSNFTDVDPLQAEPAVSVRWVHGAADLGRPDLIVLPGTKATVADLLWLRRTGLDRAIAASNSVVLGICGGYQMLGVRIEDDVESGAGTVMGLGWLAVSSRFGPEKVLRRWAAKALEQDVRGYQIHHGRVETQEGPTPPSVWLVLSDGTVDGIRQGRFWGTTLHGLFDADGFRAAFLRDVARHSGKRINVGSVRFGTLREASLERLADVFEQHLDMEQIERLIRSAARS